MDTHPSQTQPTRLLFLGEDRLADGFRLIGFETHANPSVQEAERVLRELVRQQERAFVIVDDALMREDIPSLRQVLDEGGRVIVVAVPALNAPHKLTSDVARRLSAMFGAATLEPSQSEERQPR